MIAVRVKLFAVIRDLAGKDEEVLTLSPGSNVSAVVESFIGRYPEIGAWKHHVRVAVNQEYVSMEHQLNDDDEVVIIPPVSGG
jgi:molybdopterin converting factor subunit 1